MMGITHATSGAAAWIAITSTMPALSLGAYPLDPVGVLVGPGGVGPTGGGPGCDGTTGLPVPAGNDEVGFGRCGVNADVVGNPPVCGSMRGGCGPSRWVELPPSPGSPGGVRAA